MVYSGGDHTMRNATIHTTTLIWAPSDGSIRLNQPSDLSQRLNVNPTASNGQRFSFDAFDQILAVAYNKPDPTREPPPHAPHYTEPDVWRRDPSWVIDATDGLLVLHRASNESFKYIAGSVELRELWGIRYETPAGSY